MPLKEEPRPVQIRPLRAPALLAAACWLMLQTASALAVDTAEAIQALVAFKEGCKRGEVLWRAQLCGPIVLVDPETRAAVANQPDPAGKFQRQEGMFVGAWSADM